jgi:hypothetical protein
MPLNHQIRRRDSQPGRGGTYADDPRKSAPSVLGPLQCQKTYASIGRIPASRAKVAGIVSYPAKLCHPHARFADWLQPAHIAQHTTPLAAKSSIFGG